MRFMSSLHSQFVHCPRTGPESRRHEAGSDSRAIRPEKRGLLPYRALGKAGMDDDLRTCYVASEQGAHDVDEVRTRASAGAGSHAAILPNSASSHSVAVALGTR